MAGPFQQLTPDCLQIREGGGCMSLFGLPFFGAGVFLLLAVLGLPPVGNADEMSWLGWAALALMDVAFTAVGGGLLFGRSWTNIDVAQRLVTKQMGLLVPLRARTFPLDDYTAVMLRFIEGDSDTSDSFPVALKARAGADLPLRSFTTYAESRACATAVAQHVRLDLEDASTDHPIRLAPGEADSPFQYRLRTGPTPEQAARPPATRCEVSSEAGQVRIVIPQARIHPIALAAGLIPVVIAFVIAVPLATFFRQTRTPDVIAWIVLGFLALVLGLLPAATVVNAFRRSRHGGTIVRISPQGIRIEERGAWRTRTIASLDASDILDVDYSTRTSTLASSKRVAEQKILEARQSSSRAVVGPRMERLLTALARFAKGGGLTVKTRQGLTHFGKGLEDEEIRYLYSVLRRALDGQY